MKITPIEHPHRPSQATFERRLLETMIERHGIDWVAGGLMTSAMVMPGEGSFAGYLWAVAEFVRTLANKPPLVNGDFLVIKMAARMAGGKDSNSETLEEMLAHPDATVIEGEPTEGMINAAAKVLWDDMHATRAGSTWESRDPNEVIVIQLKATARAALIAAFPLR